MNMIDMLKVYVILMTLILVKNAFSSMIMHGKHRAACPERLFKPSKFSMDQILISVATEPNRPIAMRGFGHFYVRMCDGGHTYFLS